MNELDLLARKYGTDKQTNDPGDSKYHGYTSFYHGLFENFREDYTSILEIGVQNGYSHRMWRDYFPNATIYGIDTDSIIKEDRIETIKGRQEDPDLLQNCFFGIEFDLIIDDGGHNCWEHQISFRYLFHRLKSDRHYIIEDLETAYMRKFREHDDIRSSTIEWMNSMATKDPFSYYIPQEELFEIQENIDTLYFSGQLGVFKKK